MVLDAGCEGGLDGVTVGRRALPSASCDWACQTLFFSYVFPGNERFYRKQPGRITTIGLELSLVFMFVEGSIQEMSDDNNNDQ